MFKPIAFLFLSIAAMPIFAENIVHKQIQTLAENTIAEHITAPEFGKVTIKAAKLDPRLNFETCLQPLLSEIVNGKIKKNSVVKVTCQGIKGWHTYVQVKVKVTQPVVVARQQLNKGALLSSQNLSIAYKESHQLRGSPFIDPSQLYGAKTKRRIPKGRVLKKRDLCYICKGDRVVIKAKVGGLEIKTSGIATSSAAIGDTIRAKNIQTQRNVTGKVTAVGEMEVNL